MTVQITSDEAEDIELMARYGIIRTPVYQYHYKLWRYGNLADALAQAKRDISES
jgi:hypothetical protein